MIPIYLGWANHRKAYTIKGLPVVLLQNGEDFRVVQGQEALDCKGDLTALTQHLCGIRKTPEMAALINKAGTDQHKVNAYNAIFDKHWSKT